MGEIMSKECKTGPARIPPPDPVAMANLYPGPRIARDDSPTPDDADVIYHDEGCPGSGQTALLEPQSGFYGCGVCKVPQGVILRAGNYITPSHNFGEMFREPGDTTFVLRVPEHSNMPILRLAAQQGLSKDMTIDLLLQGIMRMQAMLNRKAEAQATAAMQSNIILTGIDKPS